MHVSTATPTGYVLCDCNKSKPTETVEVSVWNLWVYKSKKNFVLCITETKKI